MESLQKIDDEEAEEHKLYRDIFGLLSFEKVTFNGNEMNMEFRLDYAQLFAVNQIFLFLLEKYL